MSALTAAVEIDNIVFVQYLLAAKCRLAPCESTGFTPIHSACQMMKWHLLPTLLDGLAEQDTWEPVIFNVL